MYFACDDVQLAGVLSVMERKKKKQPRAFEVWSVFERLSPKADGPKLKTEEILSPAPAELLTTRCGTAASHVCSWRSKFTDETQGPLASALVESAVC